MYDPALGRFPSLDPIAEDFNWVSPYNYAENNPSSGIDLWGLQLVRSTQLEHAVMMGLMGTAAYQTYQMCQNESGLQQYRNQLAKNKTRSETKSRNYRSQAKTKLTNKQKNYRNNKNPYGPAGVVSALVAGKILEYYIQHQETVDYEHDEYKPENYVEEDQTNDENSTEDNSEDTNTEDTTNSQNDSETEADTPGAGTVLREDDKKQDE